MIGYLSGTVIEVTQTYCILSVAGVGYEVFMPTRTLSILPENGTFQAYIYTHVREDQIRLFGFSEKLEKQLFSILLDVSGVGPKSALAILSADTVANIERAVVNADVAFFTAIKGVGKKAAQKIIIELKSKLGSLKELDLAEENEEFAPDVIEALKSFGFKRKEIVAALKTMDTNVTDEVLIKNAIQILGRGQI